LYLNHDTLIYTGESVDYIYNLTYILNDTDSIYVKAKTHMNSYYGNPFRFSAFNTRDTFGETLIKFKQETGFQYANVIILREFDNLSGSPSKSFEVGANGIRGYQKLYEERDTVVFDTALVRGKIYHDVIKLYPPEEEETNIQLIYFAKNYGYIKI